MIPGMIGLILQFQTLILTAFAVVRERERGTLEQLDRHADPALGADARQDPAVHGDRRQWVRPWRWWRAGCWFGVEISGSFALLVVLSIAVPARARSASGC